MPRPAKTPDDQPKRARKTPKAPTEPDPKRRNPVVPEWDGPFGDSVRKLREAKGWAQWELALNLTGPDGKPFPIVAHTVARYEADGLTKSIRHQLSKAVSRIENAEQAPTVNLCIALADALGVAAGGLLEMAGLSDPRFDVENAVVVDRRFNETHKLLILTLIRQCLSESARDSGGESIAC